MANKATKRKNSTHVVFILDKSGSMGMCASSTIEGFNEYIANLKKDTKVNYTFSLTLFDTHLKKLYAKEVLTKVENLDSISYHPDGMTALYDAIGQTVNESDEKTLVVIMTDGAENSSREYDQKKINKLIKDLEAKGNFTFVFLGANQDSWSTGHSLGISPMNTSNFRANDKGVKVMMATMADNTRNFSASAGMATQSFLSKGDQDKLSNA